MVDRREMITTSSSDNIVKIKSDSSYENGSEGKHESNWGDERKIDSNLFQQTRLVAPGDNAIQVADLLVLRGQVLAEGDLILRDSTGHCQNAQRLKHAEEVVVLRPRMSTLLGVRQHIRFLPKANIE